MVRRETAVVRSVRRETGDCRVLAVLRCVMNFNSFARTADAEDVGVET